MIFLLVCFVGVVGLVVECEERILRRLGMR